ncbi:Ankyrin-1 (ANK-1) (Ankyrin-R) (Erythrocyte ankyrin) [Durusdinium trenchii]|uniref:Ankyrin-1 (ANK-1) (Ankyrin-R) (Erythrocyte ankyrin) n=1 Tax=Durusdinium trenchii TaxID=1381693 RepID=A0ABP0L1E3_9DINO
MGPDDRRSVELGEECAFEAQESSVSDGDSVERMAGLEDFTDVVAHRADLDHMDIFSLAAQDYKEVRYIVECYADIVDYYADFMVDDLMIAQLIAALADVNETDRRPQNLQNALTMAVLGNNARLTTMLCRTKADVASRVLRLAREKRIRFGEAMTHVARLQCGAVLDVPSMCATPDIIAHHSLSAEDSTPDIVIPDSVINSVPDVVINSADENGQTALHRHAAAGRFEDASLLVQEKARIDIRDAGGNAPIDLVPEMTEERAQWQSLLGFVALASLSGEEMALPISELNLQQDFVHCVRQHLREYYQLQGQSVSYFTIRVIDGEKVLQGGSWEALGKPGRVTITLGNFATQNLETEEQTRDFLKLAGQEGAEADQLIRGHLQNFQDPNVTNDRGETAAFKASRNGDLPKLEILELGCADFNQADNGGATPLFIVAQHGWLNAAKFLVLYKAEVDKALNTEATPMYVAAQNGHTELVSFLLESKANLDARTTDGATPLFIASQMGHYGVVEMLLIAGSSFDIPNRTGAAALFIAAQNNHADIVQLLLSWKASLEQRTAGGASPVYIAAQKGCDKSLKLLLDARAEPNVAANDGATPLLIASQNGNQSSASILLSYGALVNKAMSTLATPLFVSAQNGHLDVAKLLVEWTADVQLSLENGTSPAYVAAQNGHKAMVKFLCKQKADIEATGAGGATAFFIAAQNGHLGVMQYLLKHIKKLRPAALDALQQLVLKTKDRSTPLLVSSQNGHMEVVCFLTKELEALSQTQLAQVIDHQKEGGASALYLASQNGHANVVTHLLALRASVDLVLTDTLETPLFIACQGGHEKVVIELLENGSKVNQPKHDETNPLYIACQNGHTSLVPHLLGKGAEVNHRNKNGATPLFIACQKGHTEIVGQLLEKRADVEQALASNATPLYIASSNGHSGIVEKLLEEKADANKTPGHETTPLSVSVQNRHPEVAELLLAKRVEVNKGAKKEGWTPLHFAIKGGDLDMVRLLVANGADPEQKDKSGRDSWKLAEEVPEKLQEMCHILSGALPPPLTSRQRPAQKTPSHCCGLPRTSNPPRKPTEPYLGWRSN